MEPKKHSEECTELQTMIGKDEGDTCICDDLSTLEHGPGTGCMCAACERWG